MGCQREREILCSAKCFSRLFFPPSILPYFFPSFLHSFPLPAFLPSFFLSIFYLLSLGLLFSFLTFFLPSFLHSFLTLFSFHYPLLLFFSFSRYFSFSFFLTSLELFWCPRCARKLPWEMLIYPLPYGIISRILQWYFDVIAHFLPLPCLVLSCLILPFSPFFYHFLSYRILSILIL